MDIWLLSITENLQHRAENELKLGLFWVRKLLPAMAVVGQAAIEKLAQQPARR